MAGFADLIESGVSIANTLTDSLQSTVTHKTGLTIDKNGKPTFGTSTSRKAIVQKRSKLVRTTEGQEILSKALITFPYPVTITDTDIITLPDSSELAILFVKGVVDPDTNAEYMVEVELG
tara:strand:+ start:97 stop:456 length:360 start_codon:yes stop_codon:yes gene_type:complete